MYLINNEGALRTFGEHNDAIYNYSFVPAMPAEKIGRYPVFEAI